MDIQSTDVHLKKRLGALLGFSIMAAIILMCMIACTYAFVTEGMPVWIFLVSIIIPIFIMGGLIVSLIQRNREIEGGEEDEASKY